MSQDTKQGNEGRARTRKYTKRTAGERVASKVEAVENLAKSMDLSPEILAVLEQVKTQAVEKADAGELKPTAASAHPILAQLNDELKRLKREQRSADIRDRRLIEAQIEAECYAKNASFRDTMLPWVESAIETVRTQIEAGETVTEPERPDVERVNVAKLIEARMDELKTDESQDESEDDDGDDSQDETFEFENDDPEQS